ncbi:hypothetical protein [Streptomyces sp. NRRL F-5755]|uniref:hypothetical protein n=1 Tax=Streptomyces sp. NRRL F-5755 TaxID=1519475 RepID=UPI000A4850BC|nr:hypothetical protein [Streptomyces sp. NRRL F-5755]
MKQVTRALCGAAGAVLSVALLAGCFVGDAGAKGEAGDIQDPYKVGKHLDVLLNSATSAVKPSLKWRDGATETQPLNHKVTNKPDGTVVVSKTRYMRTKVARSKVDALANSVQDHCKGKGYKITSVNPKEPSFVALTSDGYSLRFSVGAPGNVYLDAAGPPARDPGTSGEDTLPGLEGDTFPKDAKGQPDIMPDLEDTYWSH